MTSVAMPKQIFRSRYGSDVLAVEEGTKTLNEQSESLLGKLRNWSREHSNLMSRANVRVRSHNDFLFVVMQKEVPYDWELSDALTDLDIDVANNSDFSLLNLNVLAIPRCSNDAAQAFVDWDRDICIADFTENAPS